jgi:hypothetical protein
MRPAEKKLNSKTLHSEARESFSNVYEFMKRETQPGLQGPLLTS